MPGYLSRHKKTFSVYENPIITWKTLLREAQLFHGDDYIGLLTLQSEK